MPMEVNNMADEVNMGHVRACFFLFFFLFSVFLAFPRATDRVADR